MLNDKSCCDIKFLSWTYDGFAMDLQPQSSGMDLSSFEMFNPHWGINSTSAKRVVETYECCDEPYISIIYTLCLEHKDHGNEL